MKNRKPHSGKNRLQVTLFTSKKEITGELDLHGYTIEDGIALIDDYLDKAYLYGVSPVRLVHGHGTGRLRKAIREYLSTHPHVTRYGPANPNFGGEAVTKVYLKIH